jgi:endonuclease VIII
MRNRRRWGVAMRSANTGMPEGDTIAKLARFLAEETVGCSIRSLWVRPRDEPSAAGCDITSVSCKGKHLFMALSNGATLRSHLGMYGAWHRYRPDSRWRRPRRQASIVVDLDDWRYVCFNAKEVEWLKAQGPRHLDRLNRLGPDLIATRVHPSEIRSRVNALTDPSTLAVDLLLDQRIAAGIGNVYKSELLFLEGIDPIRRVGDLGLDRLEALYRRAARLLRANLGGGRRTTRANPDGRGRLWVYGRYGLPCLRCGEPIRRESLGTRPRSTYWCPRCQRG